MLKANKGITLVALVITIIVLLILAGVSISMLFGTNGLIPMSQNAVNTYKNAQENEQVKLNEVSDTFNNYIYNVQSKSTQQ